jgi:uroporphyrinogen-III synthase
MSALAGRKILITRAWHQAHALASALEEEGAEILAIPAIEIVPPDSYEPLDAALRELPKYEWLVLTSANGVRALAERMEVMVRTMLAPPDVMQSLAPVRIAAMGPATARALEAHGLLADVVPKKYIAESLADALRDQVHGQNVLLVRAKVARDVLPSELEKSGANVNVVDAYQTIVPNASCRALQKVFEQSYGMPHAATFTSSSTVTNFFRLLQEAGIAGWPPGMAAASIGPITTKTLLDHGIEPVIEASEYTIPGLVAALCRWAQAN